MKNFSLLHSRVGSLAQRLMVMFCVLMLGATQVWGGIYTWSFNDAASLKSASGTITKNGVTWSFTNSDPTYGNGTQIGSKNNPTSIVLSATFDGSVTKVTVTGYSYNGKHTYNIKIGGSSVKSGSTGSSSSTYSGTSSTTNNGTVEIDLTKANSGSRALYITNITVTYLTTVTLKKNSGIADGSVKFNHDATTYVTNSLTQVSCTGYTCTGYWTATSGGTKVLNANGSFANNNVTVSTTDYVKSGKWAYTGATLDLNAQWTCTTPTFSTNLSTTQVDYDLNAASVTALSVTASANNAGLTYAWEKSTNGTSGWTSVGTNSNSFTPPVDVSGDFYYRCTVTNNVCSSSATSNVAHIRVNAACTATPSVGAVSLNGSFNLTSVGVQCASSGAGENCEITEYGWVWSDGATNTDPLIGGTGVTNAPKTSGAPSGSNGSFTGTLSGSFSTGHTYYYKAYVTNGKPATTYSTVQTFTPRSVTFKVGDDVISTVYVNSGSTVSAPADDPEKTGWDFQEWQSGGVAYDFDAAVTEDLVLDAFFTIQSFALTWDFTTGGSTESTTHTTGTVDYGTNIVYPADNTMSKTGYIFAGWDPAKPQTMPNHALTITAQWTAQKYDITYKDQGNETYSGSNGSSLPAKHTYGTATNLVDGEKTGYTFGGWFDNENCDGSAVTSLGATAYTAGMTLYAKWTANTYKVVFKANGGTGDDVEQTGFTYDESKTLTSLETIGFTAPQHKYFLGWSTNSSSTTATYADKASVSNLSSAVSGTATLYAVWKDYTYTNYRIICCTKHDVTLADNGETEEGEWIVVPDRACVDVDVALEAEAKTGYEFAAWEITKTSDESDITDAVIKSGSSKTNAEATIVMPDYGITVNATFSPLVYNITYKDKGDVAFSGTHETGYPTTHTYNAATTLKGATKTDYNFIGWYTDPDCTAGNEISTIAANSITADITLYAKWVEDNKWVVTISAPENGGISVTYDGMESPLTSGSREILKNTEITITATGNTGYDCTSLTKDGAPYTSGTSMTLTSAITIAATFGLHEYTVTYENMEGATNDDDNPATFVITDPDIVFDEPTKTGYTFKGWFSDDGVWEDEVIGIVSGSHENVVVYAKWEINEYTLTWNLAGGKVKTAGTHAAVDAEGTPNGKVEYNADITAPVVEKTGYDFTSWSEEVPDKMPAGDKTYTAQWTIKNYEVHWWVNGHEWTDKGGSTNADYNTKVTLPTAPTKADGCGDKFVGWTTSEYEHSTEAPGVLFKTQEDSPAITGVTNFYAVFADYGE